MISTNLNFWVQTLLLTFVNKMNGKFTKLSFEKQKEIALCKGF